MDTIWLPPALVCYALSATGFVAGRTANRPRWADQAVPLLGAHEDREPLPLVRVLGPHVIGAEDVALALRHVADLAGRPGLCG